VKSTRNAPAATDTAPATSADATARGRFSSPWLLVIALGIGVFVGGFDQTFVVPVLAQILSDLDITIDNFGSASWIINGYLLGYTVAMPLMGRIADVYGHFRVFVASLLVFMGGSVLVALAPNLALLTAARAVTALGGGALVPVALAIAANRLPPRRRPLAMSSISMLDDASSLIGPLWGTLIGVWIGWRGLFWMNIVLGVPVLLAVIALGRGADRRDPDARVDWPGGALLTAGLLALTFALSDDRADPRPAGITIALYLAAAAMFAAFAWWQLRAPNPLIDLRMFRSLRLSAANIAFLLEGGALIVALVNIPLMTDVLWLEHGAQPGLTLGRMVLFMIIGGILGGVLAPIIGFRITAFAGFALAAAGLFGMRAWPEVPGEAAKWAALATAGLGFTLADAPIYATVVNAIEPGRRASATAVLQVFQTTGMIIAMSLLGSQGFGRFKERGDALIESGGFEAADKAIRTAQHATFDETFLVAGLLMVVAGLLTLTLQSRSGDTTEWGSLIGNTGTADGP
jgi:MFS family permease